MAPAVKLGEKKMRMAFFKTFSCADFSVVVVNKTFLGHPQQSLVFPQKSPPISNRHPTPQILRQIQQVKMSSDGFDVFLKKSDLCELWGNLNCLWGFFWNC